MSSSENMESTLKAGGANTSVTPSIALLNQRLGTSPAPRMLTPSEVDLLRQCVKEASDVALEVLRVAEQPSENLSTTERDVLAVVEQAPSKSMEPSTAVYKEVESGRWAGNAKIEVAAWLKRTLLEEKRWKEESKKERPANDADYQRTLVVQRWLAGE